ncbi:tyrosine-protein phosphatase [Paenibacillus hamazuiensis]|uniref:tyrosine-protein phosphatase n=1 Tax=Paenibacillus hamazuiensis TaxID=2936508 RepID=UPI00200E4E92
MKIYWSPSPDSANGDRFLLTEEEATEEEGISVILEDPNPGRRAYYHLRHEHGAAGIVAERRLPLEGAVHLRDLGGYDTEDGRSVKWGQLYRSEQLSDLTEADRAYLQSCGLKLICDYRADNDPFFAPYAEIGFVRHVRLPVTTTETAPPGERLIRANQNYVSRHAQEFSHMLHLLLEENGFPLLQHCVAGKDRTGFGAAIVLLALGVPEATVMEDYLLTSSFKDALYRKLLKGSEAGSAAEDTPGILEARPEYLQAAFDEMRSGYGSVRRYLESALGLTRDKRTRLQELLLTE